MDFIDYQSFAVIDQSSEEANHDPLPEPSSTLNISSAIHNDTENVYNEFKLPSFIASSDSAEGIEKPNLYDRMARYAKVSIDSLNISETRILKEERPVKVSSRFKEPTKATRAAPDFNVPFPDKRTSSSDVTNVLLSRKLSNVLTDYILTNYKGRTELRKSLNLLEKKEDSLPCDLKQLIDSGYIGTLARKTFRSDIENELLKEHLIILEEFRPIIRRINRLSDSVTNIKSIGDEMLKDDDKINVGKATTIKELSETRADLNNLYLQKKLLIHLQNYFTLTQVEDDSIFNGPLDSYFFEVVDKLVKIKKHATFLLSLPDDTAGSSLLNKLTDDLKFVNTKVFNFLVDFLYQYESTSKSDGDKGFAVDVMTLNIFQKGLVYLTNDLEHLDEFIKKVTAIRSKIILDEFLSYFDYDPKDTRSITISAHNPLRYIGDVLANVHSSIANEADFVKSIFHFQVKQLNENSSSLLLQNTEYLNGLDVRLLNQIVQSLSNSCRIRIEQVVRFEENPVINLEIVRLLELYQVMFEKKGIEVENSLILNLKLLLNLSKEKTIESFSKIIQSIPTSNNASSDYMPPDWLSDYTSKLADFFEAYEKGKSVDVIHEDQLVNVSFLKKTVEDPLINILQKVIQNEFPTARKNEEARSSLFTMQINCFDLVKSRLLPFSTSIFSQNEETKAILDKIDEKLKQFVNRMLELQKKFLFEKTGLDLYHNLFNMIFPISSIQDELDYDMYLSLSDNPLMNLDTIMDKVHVKLNDYLPQALTDLQGNLLFKLTSPSIADDITDSCFQSLSEFYIKFRRILIHLYPENKDNILAILNFTEEEFIALVGIN